MSAIVLLSSLCLAPVLLLLLAVAVTLLAEAVQRWRYRHIPGPRDSWFLGYLSATLRDGVLGTIDKLVAAHGQLFKLRLTCRLFVVVADPDAARTVLTKCLNHATPTNPNMHLVHWEHRKMDDYGLLLAKDDTWRTLRTAWQPAFAPASLAGYQALMDREALALVRRLGAAAFGPGAGSGSGAKPDPHRPTGPAAGTGVGEAGRELDIFPEIYTSTLAVVGSAAYGVDFNAPEYQRPPDNGPAAPTSASALSLPAACREWFRTMSPAVRSCWALLVAVPCALPLGRLLANACPDTVLATHIAARRVLMDTARKLMDDWRKATQQQQEHEKGHRNGVTDAANGSANAALLLSPAPSLSAPRGSGGSSSGRGVAPGSFLGLMLAARDRSSGSGLTDDQIMAQVQTFILGGFETTATTLACAVYLLARHPEAEARLHAELDALLPPPPPPPPSGEKGGEADNGSVEPLSLEVLDKLVYTHAVVEEALRLYPPAHATTRITDKPMKVLGHELPAGTDVLIPVYHLQRSTALWPDPEAFRPERFLPGASGAADGAPSNPHAFMPFGAGTRMCVGWRFGMQEAKTTLARLCQHYSFELAPGQVPLPLSAGLTLAPKHGVIVRLRRRR